MTKKKIPSRNTMKSSNAHRVIAEVLLVSGSERQVIG